MSKRLPNYVEVTREVRDRRPGLTPVQPGRRASVFQTPQKHRPNVSLIGGAVAIFGIIISACFLDGMFNHREYVMLLHDLVIRLRG